MKKIWIFLQDIKFEHSLFALPFAYLGLFIAERGIPRGTLFLWVTLAMISFRTMAMSANRLWDAKLDALNPRTRARAIPSGQLNARFFRLVGILTLVIFEICAYQLGELCFLLSPIPLILALTYPLIKKVSWLAHFWLGSVLAIAPYGAWIASRGSFDMVPTFISTGVVFWVAGFDMIYALQDIGFDRLQGLHSFPAKYGQDLTLIMTKALHLLSVICWIVAGCLNRNGAVFFIGVLGAVLFLNRSYRLICSAGLARINEAFFIMNAFVSIGLFITVVLDVTWKGRNI